MRLTVAGEMRSPAAICWIARGLGLGRLGDGWRVRRRKRVLKGFV
jgi:hypothetical protein